MLTRFLATFVFLTSLASANPNITGGPVNAASYVIAGLPNANIAQGSMFIVFGQNLGPATAAHAFSFPLPTSLGGTSISAKVGGTAVKGIMLFSSGAQVAAILPSTTPTGSGTLTLTANGQASNSVPINVVASTLGIFTRNQNGIGPGVLFNFNSQSDQPVNSLVEAAHPGQVLTLWGTGLGAVSGTEANGPLPGNLDVPVDVYVGSKHVTPSYKGRSGCCAGIDQVVFTVPDGVEGCYVAVHVVAGGVVSNSATIAVTPNGTVCSDPTGLSVSDLQKVQNGQTLAIADLEFFRVHAKFSLPTGPTEGTVDVGNGHFRGYVTPADLLGSTRGSVGGLGSVPSPGSCIVAPFGYNSFIGTLFGGNGDPVNQQGLDAGPALDLNGPHGAIQLPRQDQGSPGQPFYVYRTQGSILGGGLPGFLPVTPAVLDPGNYTIDDGSGGPQVGAFSAKLTIPSATPVWTNRDAITNIPRSQDLTITWSGGAADGLIAILGSAADPGTGAAAILHCLAPAEPGSFTIPSWMLSAFPASGMDPTVNAPVGFLSFVVMLPEPVRFQATGLDVGFFSWAMLDTKNVVFQ